MNYILLLFVIIFSLLAHANPFNEEVKNFNRANLRQVPKEEVEKIYENPHLKGIREFDTRTLKKITTQIGVTKISNTNSHLNKEIQEGIKLKATKTRVTKIQLTPEDMSSDNQKRIQTTLKGEKAAKDHKVKKNSKSISRKINFKNHPIDVEKDKEKREKILHSNKATSNVFKKLEERQQKQMEDFKKGVGNITGQKKDFLEEATNQSQKILSVPKEASIVERMKKFWESLIAPK